MKIVFINTFRTGGAAKAAIRLYNELNDINVQFIFQDSNTTENPRQSGHFIFLVLEKLRNILKRTSPKMLKQRSLVGRFNKVIQSRDHRLEYVSLPYSHLNINSLEAINHSEIIHLHWIADFIDWQSFFKNNKGKKIIWTLHDQNPFLGFEHYSEKYLDIDTDGKLLTRIKTKEECLLNKKLINEKIKFLKDVNDLVLVSPSRWLMQESMQSTLFSKYRHYHIPNGIESSIFRPLIKESCRQKFKFDNSKIILLFVADYVENYRKGYSLIKKAINILADSIDIQIEFVVVGEFKEAEVRGNIRALGRLNDDNLMAEVYNAADLFIIPSLVDNFPNTIIESLMCGTPVLGFNVGGVPEAIINKKNGLILNDISVNGLVNGIIEFINNIDDFNRAEIAKDAKNKYDVKIQADLYIQLYKEVLNT